MGTLQAVKIVQSFIRKFEQAFGPGVWNRIDRLHDSRSIPYPCYLSWSEATIPAIRAAVYGSHPKTHDDAAVTVALLASWIQTKGVYRFDRSLWDDLAISTADIAIPSGILRCMPERSILMPFPSGAVQLDRKKEILGILLSCHYFEEIRDGHPPAFFPYLCLQTIVDDGSLEITSLRLTENAPLSSMVEDWRGRRRRKGTYLSGAEIEHHEDVLKKVLPVVIPRLVYLCAKNAEITPANVIRKAAVGFSHKKPQDSDVRMWDVGLRLGPQLKAAHTRSEATEHTVGEAARTVRPHVRRAHFHHYWVGSKNSENGQRLEVRFVAPVLVNVTDPAADLVATIRDIPVEPPSSHL